MAFTPLKYKFDKELLQFLSGRLIETGVEFNATSFQKTTQPLLDPLELKDRNNVIADQLNTFLPGDYPQKLQHLIGILGPENEGSYGTFNDFFWTWPIGSFIGKYGLSYEKESLSGMRELTKRGTAEFAIRPFIEQNPQHLIEVMTQWSKDENFHIRRLSSEGIRPNLPWASKLKLFIEEPGPIFQILENLKEDNNRYVQTSVANNINDYFKVNEDQAMNLITEWSKDPTDSTKWIIKHAIRNYRKKGIEWAVNLTNVINGKV